ncbi:hypothetical protein GQ43DRAFT_104932 [Delitschia confertaspora ATCC 74209]|uniref:F-box domain-containing protein n=1 Tax=Delitschia confertaspora ATCC 74209 TaxID=1513339 RepID=A0A9P4JNJ5_9PLEO|nr:hypothetical protein GQ43DRAFT_104932 [Delitschia confertaspora ATCC 74209]
MTFSLAGLPFDLLFYITAYLDLDDIVHISYTCRQLRSNLRESTLCRRTIEKHSPHSTEARQAHSKQISYAEALQRVYDRRHSFSNCFPFSARIAGLCSAFTYRQGVLCLLASYKLRILDVRCPFAVPREIDISSIINSVPVSPGGSKSDEPKLSLLYYSDGIIAIHYEQGRRSGTSQILAISTGDGIPERDRLIRRIDLESSHKLFVRHTASFLYYGTYSVMGQHSHHEWVIQGVSLDLNQPLVADRAIQLEEFFGTDIGSTIAFEIHNGHFYALSNQTSFDVEELDWTSFYHCVRFPLHGSLKHAISVNKRIYRRQHAEGPIHDSWTDLSLQADETTNQLMIVEARREWVNGSSTQVRTFYTMEISFPGDSDSPPCPDESSTTNISNTVPLPDDLLAGLVDSSNNPHWAPVQQRYARYTHPEFGKDGGANGHARPFTFTRTKFRAYNYSCSSFLDIVEDEKCCANPHDPNSSPCLRLRIGSRRLEPLILAEKCWSNKATLVGYPCKKDDDRDYRYSPIRMWPPPSSTCPCAAKLHGILNPPMPSGSASSKTVTAVLDKRTLVYMIRPGRSYGQDESALGTVVVVRFDRHTEKPHTALRHVSQSPVNVDSQSEWTWKPGHASACRKRACG